MIFIDIFCRTLRLSLPVNLGSLRILQSMTAGACFHQRGPQSIAQTKSIKPRRPASPHHSAASPVLVIDCFCFSYYAHGNYAARHGNNGLSKQLKHLLPVSIFRVSFHEEIPTSNVGYIHRCVVRGGRDPQSDPPSDRSMRSRNANLAIKVGNGSTHIRPATGPL